MLKVLLCVPVHHINLCQVLRLQCQVIELQRTLVVDSAVAVAKADMQHGPAVAELLQHHTLQVVIAV